MIDSLEALRHRCKGCGKVSKKIGSQQDYCYDCKAAGKGHYSVAAFENAPDWVGTDVEITELCSGCSRGFPGYFRNRQQHKLIVILIEHPESNDSVHVRIYCRHCADEIFELLTPLEPTISEAESHARRVAADTPCTLCGDPLPKDVLHTLECGWENGPEDESETYALCGDCRKIVDEFLSSVPERDVEGEIDWGVSPDNGVSQ